MAENVCLMVTEGSEYINELARALDLAAASIDLHKRTILYLDKDWNKYAKVGRLEKYKHTRESGVKLRAFLNAGGQLWVTKGCVQPRASALGREAASSAC